MLYAVCFSVYDFDEDGRLSTRDVFRALQLRLNESLPHDFAKLLKVCGDITCYSKCSNFVNVF